MNSVAIALQNFQRKELNTAKALLVSMEKGRFGTVESGTAPDSFDADIMATQQLVARLEAEFQACWADSA